MLEIAAAEKGMVSCAAYGASKLATLAGIDTFNQIPWLKQRKGEGCEGRNRAAELPGFMRKTVCGGKCFPAASIMRCVLQQPRVRFLHLKATAYDLKGGRCVQNFETEGAHFSLRMPFIQ